MVKIQHSIPTFALSRGIGRLRKSESDLKYLGGATRIAGVDTLKICSTKVIVIFMC